MSRLNFVLAKVRGQSETKGRFDNWTMSYGYIGDDQGKFATTNELSGRGEPLMLRMGLRASSPTAFGIRQGLPLLVNSNNYQSRDCTLSLRITVGRAH